MNKMAKGALAISVGAALLLGGGGTLAVWNATDTAKAGTIASGNLQLSAAPGAWTSDLTPGSIPVATYKMIPGETLTYTQDLSVTLVGDKLTANLKATGAVAKAFGDQATVVMHYSQDAGKSWTSAATGVDAIKLQLAASKNVQTIKARITVNFANIPVSAAAPLGNSSLVTPTSSTSTDQALALTGVGFKLEQNEPTPAPITTP